MKEIYFTEHSGSFLQSIKKKILGVSSYTLAKFLPVVSNQVAEKVLCTPIKPKTKRRVPVDFHRTTIDVLGKKISIFKKGTSDKTVIFSHGWSSNGFHFSSFFDSYIYSKPYLFSNCKSDCTFINQNLC